MRRVLLGVYAAIFLATFAPPSRAVDPPEFSAPEVRDFVGKFGDLVDAYVKAVEAKDEAKMKDLDAKSKNLETLEATAESLLEPAEKEAFDKYMIAQSQKLIAAAQEAGK